MGVTSDTLFALRQIHKTGAVSPYAGVTTSYAAPGMSVWDSGNCIAHPCMIDSIVAHRRSDGLFDVVRTRKMNAIQGPFNTREEAEEAATILRMERRAERLDRLAIMKMASCAEH